MPPSLRPNTWNTLIGWMALAMYAGVLTGCGDTTLLRMTAQSTSGTSLDPASAEEGFRAMPPAELTVILQEESDLLITFTATGSVPLGRAEASLQIRCEIDGRSCSHERPDQGIPFLYHDSSGESTACCPQDSQQWLTPRVRKGFHHISILGRGNRAQAHAPSIGEWSLIVEAFTH
jgi:hypothetical protein